MTGLSILRTAESLSQQVNRWRAEGLRIALVPTMGALHEGHLSLVQLAKNHANRIIASIFVNPKQFGPQEDLGRYPRQEAQDAEMLRSVGCEVLFAPTVEEMYPEGFSTSVSVTGLSSGLCGAHRPGHFDGVATVVTKLLNAARAHVAVFGEKDYQQLQIIRRLAQDLNIGTEILAGPIVRDADGLALSSRNSYLSAQERQIALALPKALQTAKEALEAGQEVMRVLEEQRQALSSAGFTMIDYLELRDSVTLEPIKQLARPARLLAAGFVGSTRLIDNVAVLPS